MLSTVLLSKFSRRDTIAASLHRFSRSAPEKPSVFPASSCRHASLSVLSSKPIGIFLVLISNISFLACLYGVSYQCRCIKVYRKIRQRNVYGDIKATWPHYRGIKHIYSVSGYSKVYQYKIKLGWGYSITCQQDDSTLSPSRRTESKRLCSYAIQFRQKTTQDPIHCMLCGGILSSVAS